MSPGSILYAGAPQDEINGNGMTGEDGGVAGTKKGAERVLQDLVRGDPERPVM